jgi:predicted metal-dependent enzyme (double-stranded beta helix superfamily)
MDIKETKQYHLYHLYGNMHGMERDWGKWGSRDQALNVVGALCNDNMLWVDEEYYRDDPHKHQQVLVCTDHRTRFFIDRVTC